MENKLMPLSDFVLKTVHTPNINEAICWEQTEERLQKIYKYTQFLKQPLALWMFVPCDEDGNVLEEPDTTKWTNLYEANGEIKFRDCKYQQAKDRVLFEGLKITDKGNFFFIEDPESGIYLRTLKNTEKTVEFLLPNLKPTLTETAIKQIYGS
ncbi:hypothetical protein HZP66_02115 [Elizabethkingia anophelis]|nr:hypothetical protein [Elizabethkingia anophelis]